MREYIISVHVSNVLLLLQRWPPSLKVQWKKCNGHFSVFESTTCSKTWQDYRLNQQQRHTGGGWGRRLAVQTSDGLVVASYYAASGEAAGDPRARAPCPVPHWMGVRLGNALLHRRHLSTGHRSTTHHQTLCNSDWRCGCGFCSGGGNFNGGNPTWFLL